MLKIASKMGVSVLQAYQSAQLFEAVGLSRELVDRLHALGLVVNCWTVDDVARAEALIAMGVDQITTNILE